MGDLADLLVLEQPAHQLGAGILPVSSLLIAGQEHLHLEPHQPARHLEVVGGLIEPEMLDRHEELIGDARDGNVGDVDLLFAEQMQQQIERTGRSQHRGTRIRSQSDGRGEGQRDLGGGRIAYWVDRL